MIHPWICGQNPVLTERHSLKTRLFVSDSVEQTISIETLDIGLEIGKILSSQLFLQCPMEGHILQQYWPLGKKVAGDC